LDKLEKDDHFLNIDPEMKLQSFTSCKNPSPTSIQVIMRTQEITLDNGKNNTDLEKSPDNIGFFARVGQIFKKLWNGVFGFINIFH